MNQDNQRQTLLYSYLAGLIDGEGTIRISKCNYPNQPKMQPHYSAAISIGMTSKKALQLLEKVFGTKVRIELGGVPNRQNIYRWGTAGNKRIPPILEKLLPYLVVKKKQAQLVLKFCQKITGRNRWIRRCRECRQKKQVQGYGLCGACYQKRWKNKELNQYKQNYLSACFTPIKEIQLREEFYQKIRKLNAVGVAATTKREDTQKGEVIV